MQLRFCVSKKLLILNGVRISEDSKASSHSALGSMVLELATGAVMPVAFGKTRWEDCGRRSYLGARPRPSLVINLPFENQFLACPLGTIGG